MMKLSTAFPLFAASVLMLSVGCDDGATGPNVPVMAPDDHDHDHGHGEHAHPETLGAALAELTELRNTVRDAFAKNDTETAHEPLHDVGHLLNEVDELAGETDLSDDVKAAIKGHVTTLMDAFGAVDKKMHSESGEEGSDYSAVSEKIDTAIQAIIDAAGEHAHHDAHEAHGDHDHDHAEHTEKPAGDAGHKHADDDHKADAEKAAPELKE
ncbi:MAG: hypothetical protein R3C49_15505 [Planctomycetaceae bacterium]